MNLVEKCKHNANQREHGVLDKNYRRTARKPMVSQRRFGFTLTTNFNEEQHHGLHSLAKAQNTTAGELVRRAVQATYFSKK